MTNNAGGDVIHGPHIISDNSVTLSVGDTVAHSTGKSCKRCRCV